MSVCTLYSVAALCLVSTTLLIQMEEISSNESGEDLHPDYRGKWEIDSSRSVGVKSFTRKLGKQVNKVRNTRLMKTHLGFEWIAGTMILKSKDPNNKKSHYMLRDDSWNFPGVNIFYLSQYTRPKGSTRPEVHLKINSAGDPTIKWDYDYLDYYILESMTLADNVLRLETTFHDVMS